MIEPNEKLREPNQRTNYKMSDAPEDYQDKIDSAFTLKKLTDDERDSIKKHIKDALNNIEDARNEYGLYDTWKANEDQYYGILPEKTFPFENGSNYNVPLTREKVDVVVNSLVTAVHTPDDLWEVLPTESNDKGIAEKIKSHTAKQKFLTFECKQELNYEEEDAPVIFESVLHGTGWLELPWHYETDTLRDIEVYTATPEGLMQFLKNYPSEDKADNPDDWKHYKSQLERMDGVTKVEIVVEYDTPVWDNPKPKHIAIRDFFIHPKAKSVKDSSCHGKRHVLTGAELLRGKQDGKFIEEDVEELRYEKNSKGEDEEVNDFLTREYTCFTMEVRYSFGKDDIGKKYLVDILWNGLSGETEEEDEGAGEKETDSKCLLLRVRRFPYWHNRPYFIPKYISEKKEDGIYREGLCEMLTDGQDLSNVALNFFLDCLLYGSIPIVKGNLAERKTLSKQLSKGLFPGLSLWTKNPNDITFTTTAISPAVGELMNVLKLGAEAGRMAGGGSENMSGRESVSDPRAPAAKTQMLLQQANKKIAGFIHVLQRSNREVAFQLIELYYQYRPNGKVYRSMGEDGQWAFPKISREELRERSEYRPVGSIETVDKGLFLQQLMSFYELSQKEPLLQFPENRRFLLENIMRTMGGILEQSMAKVLPSDEQIKQREIMMRAQALIMKEKMQKAEMRAEGMKARARELLESGVPREAIEAQLAQEFPPIPGTQTMNPEQGGLPNGIPGQMQAPQGVAPAGQPIS